MKAVSQTNINNLTRTNFLRLFFNELLQVSELDTPTEKNLKIIVHHVSDIFKPNGEKKNFFRLPFLAYFAIKLYFNILSVNNINCFESGNNIK